MDNLNKVLDILKEKPYNLRSLGKDILQAVIDDLNVMEIKQLKNSYPELADYTDDLIKEFQTAMGRIEG